MDILQNNWPVNLEECHDNEGQGKNEDLFQTEGNTKDMTTKYSMRL